MIIQDAKTREVLSLVYGNKESIQKMKETRFVWRYSRSKKRIMQKGEESGNVQKVVSIVEDCDSDALLVLAQPSGPACHKGTGSCFSDAITSLESDTLEKLEQIIENRIKNPKEGSYTAKLAGNGALLNGKLREELYEFIYFKDKDNLNWEMADLLYFMLVLLKKNEGSLKEVKEKLQERMKI